MSGATTTQTRRVCLFPVKGLVFDTLPTAAHSSGAFFFCKPYFGKNTIFTLGFFHGVQPRDSLDKVFHLSYSLRKLD